ncbi:hypothetical protein [Microbacterium sp. AG790]|uniref:hypothetical protein n=1 Tax=Microbacterium sp. AG790 TaxID=2183995 RepID=UPI0011C480AC|nr:hypothetical protein [Microbacterium sp. AG790]
MEDKLLTGGEGVANRAYLEGVRRPLAHTSPYLTRLLRHISSSAVHVVGMSDTSVDLDPFEMWDEVELSARTGFHVRQIQLGDRPLRSLYSDIIPLHQMF